MSSYKMIYKYFIFVFPQKNVSRPFRRLVGLSVFEARLSGKGKKSKEVYNPLRKGSGNPRPYEGEFAAWNILPG